MIKSKIFFKILNRYRLQKASKGIEAESYTEAEKALKLILKREPNNRRALQKYAEVATYREAWAKAAGRWDRFIEVTQAAGKQIPKEAHKNIKQTRLKLSKDLYKAEKFVEAERQLEKVIAIKPKNFLALKKLAEISSAQGNWPVAVERWEQVVAEAEAAGEKMPKETKKKLKKAIFKYAHELGEAGRSDEAEKHLKKVVALEPDNLKALVRLADNSSIHGNWSMAFEGWERVIKMAEAAEKKLPKSEVINFRNFKRYLNAGLLNEKDANYIDTVQDYWRLNYGKIIDPSLHLAFYNLTGRKEPRIIPREQMWNEIIPFFNDMNMWIGYSDKNIYDKLITNSSSAINVLKRVRGSYFDHNNNSLATQEAFSVLLSKKSDFIIKPSKTDNGLGIIKLKYMHSALYLGENKIWMNELEDIYGSNFIVQEIIQQHPVMAAPHPSSINTLRIVTFRWKKEIIHLLTFARFGSEGSIRDNAGRGGLCCGITDSGQFMDFAIDEHTKVYSHHPTTKYCFADRAVVPNYEYFINFVIGLHKDILHFDFVSWDIVVGKDGQPIFLEANYRGATWLYQLATQRPIFGELTEEVLNYISDELKKDKNIRDQKANID